MTTTASTTTTYRRTYFGLWMGASLLFALCLAAGYPLVGVFGAGANTIAVVGLSSAVFFPTMTALWTLDVVTWPLWLANLGYFVAGLFALWGMALAVARLRR